MSRYCTGDLVINQDRISLTGTGTSFLMNTRPGDALLLNSTNYAEDIDTWCLYTVTKVISDTVLMFTPRFETGDPSFDNTTNPIYQKTFHGQIDSQLSSDGRFCPNSEWYISRDFTCFYSLPEIKRGDRAWADIYNTAIRLIDDLMKNNTYGPITEWDYSGGYVKFPKGTIP